MRILTVALTLLLALTGCAPAASPPAPTTVPAQDAGAAPAKYETAALVAIYDNKQRAHQLQLVDPSNGQPVAKYAPIAVGANYYYAFSPDHNSLAVLAYKSENTPRDPTLHWIDLSTWQDRATGLKMSGWVLALAFSPDGKRLAVSAIDRESTLLVFDLEHGVEIARIRPEMDIARMQFSWDGSSLMAYGRVIINRLSEHEMSDGPARVALFDARDLSLRWSISLAGVRDGIYPTDENAPAENLFADPGSAMYLFPGLTFAPRHDVLYILHADEDKLTSVDFGSRSVETVAIQPKLSWIERILMLGADVARAKVANGTSRNAVISPDGKTIYTLAFRNEALKKTDDEWEFSQTPLGFQAIDIADGSAFVRLESPASELSLAPDGSKVFLLSWSQSGRPATGVFDVRKGAFTENIQNANLHPIRRMDGGYLLVSAVTDNSNRTRMTAYSMEGSLLGEWTVSASAEWLIAEK